MPQPVSLLFAELFLVWQAANYLLSADPIRSGPRPSLRTSRKRVAWLLGRAAVAAVSAGILAGPWPAVTMFAGCLLLPLARWLWVPSRYTAELEIAANLIFAVSAYFLTGPIAPTAPEWELRTAAYLTSAALLIFVVRGGTYIVRGVLDRAGTMPPPEFPPTPRLATPSAPEMQRALPVDTVELNHGRLIGNVERLILVLFVAQGQYTALAFFFAAKGLIRSKDVERRAWADYLILGSLTSFLVAVIVGLLIQMVFQALPIR